MMTHKEAMDKVADKININTESINYEDIVDLIIDIYESIGSCSQCKYYKFVTKRVDKICILQMMLHKEDFYCADFKPKEK